MLEKFAAVVAWALLVFIVYATVSPIQARPTLSTSSGFEHLAAFVALGLSFGLAYPRRTIMVCLIVLGSAVLLEFIQLITPDRHGRVGDAIEKLVGGAVGILAARTILLIAKLA